MMDIEGRDFHTKAQTIEDRGNKDLKDELVKTLNMDHILKRDQVEVLDKLSKYRASLFALQRVKVAAKMPDRKMCREIIASLKNLSNIIEKNKIYPKVIRVTYEVTNEYGTRYFEAVDEQGDEWTVEYRWLDPSKPYFMYSKTHPVAVDPVIIEKIF